MIYVFLKRAIDIAICVLALPFALPLCLLLALLVCIESKGSPLFVQWRVGRDLKRFRLFKLRSMKSASGDHPSHQIDPRQITRVGRWIRRAKLDELPQLINVLNGTMSCVGPRPCLPSQEELISERLSRGLFRYRPGISGPAQINNLDMSDPRRLVEAEAAYYPNATTVSDLLILIKTVFGGGKGDAAG